MNANRMRYASTPTYGMQKRGLLGRTAAPKAQETPDFTQAPQPISPTATPNFTPVKQVVSVPGQSFPQTNTSFPNSMFINQNQPMQTIQPMNQTTTIPFAAPNFIQPNAQRNVQMPMQQTNYFQNSMPMPIGNSAPAMSGNMNANLFSPHTQGYVPPQKSNSHPTVQPFASMQPTPNQSPIQSNPFPVQNQTPNFFPMQSTMQPMQNFNQGPMQQQAAPMYMNQQAMPAMPTSNGQQPIYNGGSQSAKKKREPLNPDTLWTFFLFALLPILFVPCLFVPSSYDFIRYLFLALSVCGLGGMWYRQMYTPSTRLIVSVVYVALSIVTIALMLQTGNDVTGTSANAGYQPPAAQVTIDPSEQDLVAAAAPSAEPTAAPTASGPSEAEQRLSLFMELWKSNQTPDMVSLIQPSWASIQEAPTTALFNVLSNRTATDYTIEEISGSDSDNSRTVTMTTTIDKNNGKTPSIYRFMVVMVKEGGAWYVDPRSLATNDEVTDSDENVVNDTSSSGLVSAPPRTTVTPVPPDSTTLYYNTNGGNFYHTDSECSSILKEYLPLTGNFLYSDLQSVLNELNLQPCLKCNAPINPLSSDEE